MKSILICLLGVHLLSVKGLCAKKGMSQSKFENKEYFVNMKNLRAENAANTLSKLKSSVTSSVAELSLRWLSCSPFT